MKLASLQSITDLRPIAGADFIQAATVLGYQTVVKKGEFADHDLCLWHEPDTIVPDRPEYEFLRKQNFRLKVSRFKGQVSQGLALPLHKFQLPAGLQPGDDVSDLIGVKKYEKPMPANLAGVAKGAFPGWLIKTDEPNLRSNPAALEEFQGRECVATQKIDGTSATFYWRQGVFGVCSRNLELLEDPQHALWRIAADYKIAAALQSLKGDYAIQGEVYGEGIQGNHAKIRNVALAVFNLFDIVAHAFIGYDELATFCQSQNLPLVRPVWRGAFGFTLDQCVALANQQEYTPGAPAEGLVFRTVKEARSLALPSGRLSAKVVSEAYCLKYGE